MMVNTEKQSFTAAIAGVWQAISSSSPENKIRWAEYLLIVLAAMNQLCWKPIGSGQEITPVIMPIALLFILTVVNSLPIPQNNGLRLAQIFAELSIVAIGSFLGPHRVYRQLYLVVIGKGALVLNRLSLIVVVLVALIQQIVFVRMTDFTPIRYAPLFPSLMNRRSILNTEYVVYYVLDVLLFVLIATLFRSEQESRRKAEALKLEMDSMALTLERERIARDIHDSLGHALTGLNVQLQLAQKLVDSDPTKSREAIALARGFATRAVADVRRAVRAVRDSYFDFPGAVKELVETIESSGGCKVTSMLDCQLLPPQLSHDLFFLIQEALTNVQRHAHATSVDLELSCGDQVHLRVKDNGIGFSKEGSTPGFGITGMEERVASLGGTITIDSAAGAGTDISITIPTKAPMKDS
jgi:signal transduction histidine kinase